MSTYSPDLNAIEQYWLMLKNRIKVVRKTAEFSTTSVEQRILSTQSFGLSYCPLLCNHQKKLTALNYNSPYGSILKKHDEKQGIFKEKPNLKLIELNIQSIK